MGLENRDYARGGSSSDYGGGYSPSYTGYGSNRMPPGCRWILTATILIFVVQLLWKAPPSNYQVERYQKFTVELLKQRNENFQPKDRLTSAEIEAEAQARAKAFQKSRAGINPVIQRGLELDANLVFPGFQLWRMVTYAFCHDTDRGPWHIVLNMLAFWFFAPTIERMYGTREFLGFYFAAAIVSALAFLGLELWLGNFIPPLIGASGAVMAVLMLYAVHYPRQIVRIWGIIPVEVRWIVGIFVVVDAFPVLKALGGGDVTGNVAHSAHLGGLAFGYLYFKFQIRFEHFFGGFKMPSLSSGRSQGDLRIYEPPDPNSETLDEQVDAILEKISQTGEASLTDQEREVLKAASQKYKRRS